MKALKKVIEALNARSPAQSRPHCVGRGCLGQSIRDSAVRARRSEHARSQSRAGCSRVLDRRLITDMKPKPPFPGSSSTGRRLALARWLTSRARARRRFWLACWPTESGNTISGPGWPRRRTILVTRALRPTHPELLELLARRTGALGLERQGPSSPDPVLLGFPAIECTKSTGYQSSILTTACSRSFLSGGWMPRRSVTPCLLPPESWITGRGAICPDRSHRHG